MRWIDGHHFELVIWQGSLKFFEFGYPTRPFRDVGQSVKFLSFALLDGTTLFEVVYSDALLNNNNMRNS